MKRRRGATLVELLVALPVGAIVGAIAVSLLLDSNRTSRRVGASTALSREMRQAVAVLASEVRPLSAGDLIAWTDTSLDMRTLVGSGVVCATTGTTTIDMLPLHGNDALRTAWFATPQGGDVVSVAAQDSGMVPQQTAWYSGSLNGTGTSTTSSCFTSAHFVNGTSTGIPVRLSVTGLSHTPATGSLVRIGRRARYSLYKASDNLWYLGRKSFNGASWTTIQPVAGPFDKPSSRGLYVVVRDSNGTTIPIGSTRTPQSVALVMHASSAWKTGSGQPGVRDSVLMHVTLRGQMPARTP